MRNSKSLAYMATTIKTKKLVKRYNVAIINKDIIKDSGDDILNLVRYINYLSQNNSKLINMINTLHETFKDNVGGIE